MGVKPVAEWIQQRHAKLHMARWLLEFDDKAAERDFRRYDDAAGVRVTRFAIGVALLLHIGYGIAEFFLFSDGVGEATLIRVVTGIGPFGVAAVVVTRWPTWSERQLQPSLFALGSLTMAGFALQAHVTPFPTSYVQNALAITLLGVIGITRVRLHTALALAAGYAAAQVGVALDRGEPATVLPLFVAPATGLAAAGIVMAYALERLRRTDYASQREAELERERSDELLHSILPAPIADRLRTAPGSIADSASEVSVLFSDVVGFTPLSATLPAEELVRLLDVMFSEFDALCDRRGVEKIKTIGDAYMAVAGVPRPDPDHAGAMADLALEMQRVAGQLSAQWPIPLALRIGISSGPVVAGVIGQRKFAYDLWGDTVNTASRMESHADPGQIQVSESTHRLLQDRYDFSDQTEIEVKGKGSLHTYHLLSRKD